MSYATTDLSDANPDLQICQPIFADFGGRLDFHGPIATLKVFEDNAEVRKLLEEPGNGRVLVIDGGASERCALVGGNLGALAVKNNWNGILVFGYVRDSEELAGQDVGVKALGTHPRKSEKGLHTAHRDRTLNFAGVTFRPGEWLYADADGVVVSATEL